MTARRSGHAIIALAAIFALVILAPGCDGDEEDEEAAPEARTAPSGNGGGTESGPAPSLRIRPQDERSLPNEGEKAPAPGVPVNRGGDNSIQTFGTESAASQRGRAAAVARAFIAARARGDWEAACGLGAEDFFATPAESSRGSDEGCEGTIEALSAGIPESAFREEGSFQVLSFRTDGDSAFLIVKGNDGEPYLMPMAREEGGWRVSSLTFSWLPN